MLYFIEGVIAFHEKISKLHWHNFIGINMIFNEQCDFLALDFDGVIVDSISECLVVAHNAFYPQQRIFNISELKKAVVDESRRLRNFIRSGADYVYINLAMHENAKIHNQEEFDAFTEKHRQRREEFFDLFYKEREAFSSQFTSDWVRLNPLYAGMREFLQSFQPKEKLFIITTKKIQYVDLTLKAHHIEIPTRNKFFSNAKRAVIEELIKTFSIHPANFFFIDDQVDTLLKVRDLGIQCLLAEWGYNNLEQAAKARSAGIVTQNLQQFLAMFGPGHGFPQ
jgi:phosphoglycolate phosphatase-like HAD superfamily hydrolase